MPVQVPTTFATVINLVVTQLQNAAILPGSVPSPYVFLSTASDEELAKFRVNQDQVIRILPKTLPPDPGCQAGGGRYIYRLDYVFTVQIWNRLWTDQAGEDTEWLTDSSDGVIALQYAVENAIEQFFPIVNGTYPLIQPVRMLPGGWSFPPRKVGEWGVIQSEWSCPFQQSLS